jgi:hypothetical protein
LLVFLDLCFVLDDREFWMTVNFPIGHGRTWYIGRSFGLTLSQWIDTNLTVAIVRLSRRRLRVTSNSNLTRRLCWFPQCSGRD